MASMRFIGTSAKECHRVPSDFEEERTDTMWVCDCENSNSCFDVTGIQVFPSGDFSNSSISV